MCMLRHNEGAIGWVPRMDGLLHTHTVRTRTHIYMRTYTPSAAHTRCMLQDLSAGSGHRPRAQPDSQPMSPLAQTTLFASPPQDPQTLTPEARRASAVFNEGAEAFANVARLTQRLHSALTNQSTGEVVSRKWPSDCASRAQRLVCAVFWREPTDALVATARIGS